MGTPPLQKNGTEQAQNQKLAELTAALVENNAAHDTILAKLTNYDTAIQVAAARDEEKAKADTGLKRQVFGLFLVFLTQTAGLIGWGAAKYDKLADRVEQNTTHFTEFQAIGIEWGDAIDERAHDMQAAIKELRKQVREHDKELSRFQRQKD